MMKHNDFCKGGMVSVWVGDFVSDIQLDDYMNLSRTFDQDFGFEFNERNAPETVVNDTPIPIAELVNGFSRSASYAALIAELAKSQGIMKATTMVVFLNFKYEPERARANQSAPLKFIGAVEFS